MSNLIVHSNKCVDTPDIPCLCFFQNLCHQSLSDPLPLCKLSQNLSHTDPFHSPPVSAERSDELDEEAVVFHELATHSSCLKTCNRCSFIFIFLGPRAPDRHVTVIGDEGKAPVLVCENLRELIGRIRNREDREELLVDVTELCQMIWLHLLQPYPSHGYLKQRYKLLC